MLNKMSGRVIKSCVKYCVANSSLDCSAKHLIQTNTHNEFYILLLLFSQIRSTFKNADYEHHCTHYTVQRSSDSLHTLLFLKDSSEMTAFTVDHLNTFTTVTLQLEPTEQVFATVHPGGLKGESSRTSPEAHVRFLVVQMCFTR